MKKKKIFEGKILGLSVYDGIIEGRITSYNVCYTKLLRESNFLLMEPMSFSIIGLT